MHSRIAKILVLGALMLALPLLAHAQTSRVEGMAIQGDYIKDYTGIFTYTSGVSNVGNLVYGELGVATGGVPVDRSVGAVMGDWFEGRMGAWAIHMRQFTPQLGQGDATSNPAPGTPPLASDPNFHTSEQFDIMWGRKFGTFALGLRLNRSFGQVELDNDPVGLGNISELTFDFTQFDPNLARNVLGLGVGVGFEMSPTMNVEANLHWQSRTFEVVDTTGVTVTENDGSTAYQFAARAWWQWQPNVMVVPVVKLYSYDLSTTTGALGFDNSLAGWQAGVAGNWTIGSNDLFVLGLTFAQNKIEQEVDLFGAGFALGNITETFMPQFFAALETHVNSWLTLRFGANKGVWHSTEFEDEGTPTTLTIHDSPFSMSLGAGVKIGSLQFDAIVNDAFPHNGFNFISGATTSPVFPKVTATYAF
ncbi:MAG TPA: hypothetical protein VFQ05_10595 [Candidatus Eisenbacteria bacterium]|nr:hypothetical protein [Candidatus Eisenbacteria bacterium]